LWSRRQFLGALGATGAASALSPLLGCGAQSTGRTRTVVSRIRDEDLAAALAVLDAKLEGATVWSRRTEAYELALDHDEERFDRFREHLVVLSAVVNRSPARIVLRGPTREEVLRAAKSLSNSEIAPPMKPIAVLGVDWQKTWTRKHSDFRTPLRALFSEAQQHGGSRVIYRSSYLHSVHSEQRFLSNSQNLRSRTQRTRGGVVMGAWAGGEIANSHAQVSGQGGPALVVLSDDTIAATADRTLSHLHARSAPSGQQEVLLSPETAALLAYKALAKSPTPLSNAGAYKFRIVDDPSTGYGARIHNAAGERVVAQTLLGDGGSALSLASRMSLGNDGTLQAEPSHVRVEGGTNDLATLVARIETGVLLEGPELCRLDSRGERLAILCNRAREILKGRFTGRRFARTLTSASTADFMSNTVALGSNREVLAFDTNGIAGSAEAPHWLSRASVHKA
jgi:predicted Zn-dependent protease